MNSIRLLLLLLGTLTDDNGLKTCVQRLAI
jgi:hypothetical protein